MLGNNFPPKERYILNQGVVTDVVNGRPVPVNRSLVNNYPMPLGVMVTGVYHDLRDMTVVVQVLTGPMFELVRLTAPIQSEHDGPCPLPREIMASLAIFSHIARNSGK